MKWQKCAGISGLWVLNKTIQKKYPENMKKIKYKTIETHARAFLPLNISAVGSV